MYAGSVLSLSLSCRFCASRCSFEWVAMQCTRARIMFVSTCCVCWDPLGRELSSVLYIITITIFSIST